MIVRRPRRGSMPGQGVPVFPMIDLPLCLKNRTKPPLPVRMVGRGGDRAVFLHQILECGDAIMIMVGSGHIEIERPRFRCPPLRRARRSEDTCWPTARAAPGRMLPDRPPLRSMPRGKCVTRDGAANPGTRAFRDRDAGSLPYPQHPISDFLQHVTLLRRNPLEARQNGA